MDIVFCIAIIFIYNNYYSEYMGDDERKLASYNTYVGAAIKESLESGINGTFVPPTPAVLGEAEILFQNALATVDKKYRDGTLSYQNALHYSMMAGILRVVEPECSNTESITKRLKELYSVLKNNMNPFSMKEDDAKSLINICNGVIEMGEGYTYEEYVRDIS